MILRAGLLAAPLLGLLLCAGCAQLTGRMAPPSADLPGEPPPAEFRLEGRIAVKTEDQAFSGGIRWHHDGDRDEILFSTPLGQGVAELRRDGAAVLLTDAEGQVRQADSGEALLEDLLGVRLPVEDLLHWLVARPRPGALHVLEYDADGRVARIEQDGWQLEYGRYRDAAGRWLPGRLFARRSEQIEFRLVVDTWQIP